MAKSTGAPQSGYQKLGELHGIGDAVIDQECVAYQRMEHRRAQAREAAAYAEETVGKEPTVKGYTRV
jgi:hypothetical protein